MSSSRVPAAPKNHRRVSVAGGSAVVAKDATARKMEEMGAQREARRRAMQERKLQRQAENERNIAAGNPGDVDFIGLVRNWRIENSHTARPLSYVVGGGAGPSNTFDTGSPPPPPPRICVAVRKRPVSDKEREKCDHDSVTVLHPKVWVHAAKLKVDGIRKYLDHSSFEFDYAFDENAETLDVYRLTTLPLLQFVVNDAGRATVFCYGQTGSGKTHTMQGLEVLLAEDLFAMLRDNDRVTVTLSMYELYGGFLQDLLNDRKRVKVLEDGKGEINVTGLTEREAPSVETFHSILEEGNAARTTHATQANDSSSRSHAICTILLRSSAPTLPERRRGTFQPQPAAAPKLLGKLSLVDLAGSERGNDTTSHNAQRRSESADINTSLLALKECIRAMGSCESDHQAPGGKRPHIPYRQSKLTLILKDCLASADARTAMIATVSPGASSADHSVNTLRYADRVKERPAHPAARQRRSKSPPHPRSATTASVSTTATSLVRPVDRLAANLSARPPSRLSPRPRPPETSATTAQPSRGEPASRPLSTPNSPSDSPFASLLISKSSTSDDSLLLIDSVESEGDLDEKRSSERVRDDDVVRRVEKVAHEEVPGTDHVESRARPPDVPSDNDYDYDAALKQSTDRSDRSVGEGDEDDYMWLKREEEDVLDLHMGYINENADLLSLEGEMLSVVQMENVEDEDIQEYAATLARMLDRKEDMILSMQNRFDEFQTQLLNRRTLFEQRQPKDDDDEAAPPPVPVDVPSNVMFL